MNATPNPFAPRNESTHDAGLNEFGPAECPQVTPLAQEQRAAITTAEAAYHLNRKAQTLLIWSCKETGPIRPIKVCGRLMWRTDDLRKLVGADRPPLQFQ